MGKHCPLIFSSLKPIAVLENDFEIRDEASYCLEGECAWWIEPDSNSKKLGLQGRCAVTEVALSLDFLSTK